MLLPNKMNVYISLQGVDFRKSINGLSILVADIFNRNPISDCLFVFRNKNGDKIKILYWDRNGYALWYKRLEKGRFKLPSLKNGYIELSMQQLGWLLDGLDFIRLKGHKELTYDRHY